MIGCGGNDDPTITGQAAIDDQIIADFLATNTITATRDDSGIYYEIITENPTGNIQQVSGSILTTYYNAEVLEGEVIEIISATAGNDPAKMKQGVGAIFPEGLDIGLALMREGETYRFYLPSTLAYKDFSFSNIIPTNAIVVIEVELINIQNESDQLIEENTLINSYIATNDLNNTTTNPINPVVNLTSGEYFKRISIGEPENILVLGDNVSIRYTGEFLDGSRFDATTGNEIFTYSFNTGVVISGLDNGIAQMERGERALIIMPSSAAYKESAMYIPTYLGAEFVEERIIPTYASKVPPFKVLVFDVSLL